MKRRHTRGINPLLGLGIMFGAFWYDLLKQKW